MPLVPAVNTDDVRYLTGLAFKNIIQALAPSFQALITGDRTKHKHPTVLILVRSNQEAIAPGAYSGNFKQRVEIELQQKLDVGTTEAQEQAVLVLRQCFYRNDTDSRPNVDLANRLSVAVAQPYTCKGVVYVDEGTVDIADDVRVISYKMIFDVFAIPNR